MIKQRKLNKLTCTFEPTPYMVMYTKIKTKAKDSDRVVTKKYHTLVEF